MTMDYSLDYDDTNPISIEAHAKKLIGHTFEEVLKWNSHSEVSVNSDVSDPFARRFRPRVTD